MAWWWTDGKEAHARRLTPSQTNTWITSSKRAKPTHSHAPPSKYQDHQRPHTLCHAELKTYYTKSIPLVSNTTARHGYHSQPVHVSSVMSSCVMSCLSHITTMGDTCCFKCNVMWNSKRHTYEVKEPHQLKSHRKSNNHEGSWRVTRVNYSPLAIYTPSLYEQRTFQLGSSHLTLRVCSLFFEEQGVDSMSHYWG